ncbi:hypothetical protein M885DRAFT_162898 [Pelagophyceae sp. CCMP2097]|nr:hypothetical protein M885DRAFT_162898 [Pelagophyceae sp. CCMP2097]|mmetsp:Transcript_21108/g.71451  ORF Transcript_21108/g.71451 Transcript_21108/m.71451 type:complete len:333 (+) Transcript_21108:123-1121(+)
MCKAAVLSDDFDAAAPDVKTCPAPPAAAVSPQDAWPRAKHAHLPVDARLNILFGHVPGFALNPMFLLELPLTLALSVVYRKQFQGALMAPMFALYFWKECVCMSMVLHRYFSHKAFSCGRVTQFALYWLGCLASQGPPLWWASKHRRHHSTCDTDKDPHSPVAHGAMFAWLGWVYKPGCDGPHGAGIDEERVGDLLKFPELAIFENFHTVPIIINHLLFYKYGGLPWMLFVSMWSGVLCQLLTMYFNVAFHTPDKGLSAAKGDGECHSRDLPFDPLSQLFGEAYHNWHHVHPRAMKRPGLDMPYWLCIKPLIAVGVFRGTNIMASNAKPHAH